MKRLISLVLTVAMMFSLITVVPAQAAESWMWPTSKDAVITSAYGTRNGKKHNGLDIGGTHGKSPIYASKSGMVVASYDGCTCRSDYSTKSTYYNGSTCRHGKTLGNYVIINHGNGVYTRYMHLYWKGVAKVGTEVSQGDIIGYMGSTGRSSGVHLHFEIKTGGTGVSGGAILNGNYVNTNKSSIEYIYTPGANSGEIVTTPTPSHSYTYSNDSSHPHSEYKYCSCGSKEYTGGKKLITSCQQCYPVGNVKLTRSFEKAKGTATFYRNDVSNATSYTLKLYRNNNLYQTYNMTSDEYDVSGLTSGEYYAVLYAKNTATNEERSDSCSEFTIADTYTVSYHANGGSNAPSSQTKIEDANLTLTSSVPTKAHYVFKGWARSKNATTAEYQPGDTYNRNTNVTLYAVWEPETYTVKFDTNGGKGEISDITIAYGDTIRIPNDIVSDYSYLKGWATSKNATTATYKIGVDYQFDANTTLYAVWGTSTWSGGASSSLSGSGTVDDPYLIQSESDLGYLANKVNSQTSAPEYEYYKLTNNINLAYNEWVPIGLYGNENQYFYGSFDGNGFTISDLYITKENEKNVGLFGYVKDSEIKNLTVTGAIESITSTNALNIGSIVGYADNTILNKLHTMYFSIASISVGKADYTRMGTIAAYVSGGSVSDCVSTDSHIDLKSGKIEAGMLAGYSDAAISDCSVIANTGGLFSTQTTVGEFRLGGLCGHLKANAERCSVYAPYFSNNIKTTSTSSVGGLVGYLDGEVTVCSAQFQGDVSHSITMSGTGSTEIGGIAGFASGDAKITDCKFDGNSVSSSTTSGSTAVGGLVGTANAKNNPTVSVSGGLSLSFADLPKKEGYQATWYTDSALTVPYDFTQKVTSAMTLYAKWENGDDAPDIWDGTVSEPSYNADTKTYIITNGEELAWVSDVTNGVIKSGTNFPTDITFSGYTIALANDIYLNDVSGWENWETTPPANNWKPIGKSSSDIFSGTFNGNNYCIYGMYINADSDQYRYVGLIGYANNSIIKNVKLEDVYITSDYGIGAVVGHLNGNVQNSYVLSGKIICSYKGGGDSTPIGGIVGHLEKGNILDSGNKAVISGIYSICGGIVGYVSSDSSRVEKCFNTANLESGSVGGIVGKFEGDIIIKCFNEGNITYSRPGACAGGIVAICSRQGSDVQQSYNSGTITADQCTGGIAGIVSGCNIIECYNRGSIISKSNNVSYGGIVGYADSRSWIYYCYTSYTSTICGYLSDDSSVTSSSYKSYSALKNIVGVEFSRYIWATNSNINDGYPYLQSLGEMYKTYPITTIIDTDNSAINRSFANINGNLTGNGSNNANVGGVIGSAGGVSGANSSVQNVIAIAEGINSSHKAGNIVANNSGYFTFNKAYYNTEMNVTSSSNTIDTTGTARSEISMNVSFYTNLLGLTPYTSLADVEKDSKAVWVLENGKLPELYYNCLNDISVSEDIENGTVTVDKLQAVDGEVVTVSATPNDGYVLNKVYVDGVEQTGTVFVVDGNDEVYVTFAEEIPVFDVSITANENASASLVNTDAATPMLLSAMSLSTSDDSSITANDGEEIQVNAVADRGSCRE